MYTREEFEVLRQQWASELAADQAVQKQGLDLIVAADRHNWLHQTTWFGEPSLQLPQDLFVMQEIIWRTQPDYIVEVGVCWGGAMLFYATIMEMYGGKGIIGVDIYMPDDLKKRLMSYPRLSEKFQLITGSSVEADTVQQVQAAIGSSKKVLVSLDSFHTHDHVYQELQLYSPLVKPGQYLVCCDTIVELMPAQTHRPRPWGPGNNPMTALKKFLAENDRFEPDVAQMNKLLLTCNPGGYLKCVKD